MVPGTDPPLAGWDRLSRRLSRRFTVERMAPERTEDLCLFLKRAYADQPLARAFEDHGTILRRLRWLNEIPPGPDGQRPSGWLCLKQGRIAGYFAALPALSTARGRRIPIWWGRDLIVAPEARREGVGPLLVIAAVRSAEEKPFFIAGLNDRSFSLFRRMGFLDMGRIPLYLRVHQPDRLMDTLKWPWLARRTAARLVGAAQRIPFRRGGRGGSLSFMALERFDERFDRWWKSVEGAFPCVVRRDSATMAWRYLRHPDRRYTAFAAVSEGAFRGVGVVRHGRSRGLPAGFITEWLAHPGDEEALRGLLARAEDLLLQSAPEPMAFVRCAVLDQRMQRVLSRAGFLGVPSPLHWMMAHARGLSALDGLARRPDWFLNGGDSDLDVV